MGENTKTWWTIIVTGGFSVLLGLIFRYGWGIEAGLPKLFVATLDKNGTFFFFVTYGLVLIIYGIFQLQKKTVSRKFVARYLFKYYSIRFLAGFLFMGS